MHIWTVWGGRSPQIGGDISLAFSILSTPIVCILEMRTRGRGFPESPPLFPALTASTPTIPLGGLTFKALSQTDSRFGYSVVSDIEAHRFQDSAYLFQQFQVLFDIGLFVNVLPWEYDKPPLADGRLPRQSFSSDANSSKCVLALVYTHC